MTRLTDAERDLAAQNLGLARAMARKVWDRAHHIPDINDLCQAAMVGLCNAAHQYDPSHGVKFSTYASRACYFSALDEAANRGLIGTPAWMNTKSKQGHPFIAKAALARFPVQFVVDYHDCSRSPSREFDDSQDTANMLGIIEAEDREMVRMWMRGDTFVSIGERTGISREWAAHRVYAAIHAIGQHYQND